MIWAGPVSLALAATGAVTLDPRTEVLLNEPAIRVRDVASGASGTAARVEIARLPIGRPQITLSRAAVAALVRRAVPGITLGETLPGQITFRRPVPAAPPLSHARIGTPPDITRGDGLTLISRSGPVRVERTVTALQPGSTGGRVFVRTADGQVFAVSVAGERP